MFFRDITEIKLSRSITELERELLARYSTGRESLEHLLDQALGQVQQLLPGARCLVQLPAQDRLSLLSAPDLDPAALAAVAGQPLKAGHGSCAAAALGREAVLAPDLATDPHWEQQRAQALACGIRASWSWPVLSAEGQLLATFACFFEVPHQPRLAESLLAERVSKLLAVILENQLSSASLREQLLRYEQAARASAEVIWDWNPATDALWWHPALAPLCAYAAADIGHNLDWWLEAIHPEEQARVRASLQEHLGRGEERWQQSYRFRCGNASYLWVLHRAVLLRDESGAPSRMIGTLRPLEKP